MSAIVGVYCILQQTSVKDRFQNKQLQASILLHIHSHHSVTTGSCRQHNSPYHPWFKDILHSQTLVDYYLQLFMTIYERISKSFYKFSHQQSVCLNY